MTNPHISRIETELYRVLMAAGLMQSLHASTEDIDLIVSLPPSAYWRRDELRGYIAGQYGVHVGGRKYTFVIDPSRLMIIPEGYGTAALLCITKDGKRRQYARGEFDPFKRTIGILDIGTFSSDMMALERMWPMRNLIKSIPSGLRDVHKVLSEEMGRHGVVSKTADLDEVMRKGYFTKSGNVQVDITEVREKACYGLAQHLEAEIRSTWEDGNAVEGILITGGGSQWVGPYITEMFGHSEVYQKGVQADEHAWMTNVVGAHRYQAWRIEAGG